MELFAERLRLEAQSVAEARGASFWIKDDLPEPAGQKLTFAWNDLPTGSQWTSDDDVWPHVQRLVQRSLGTTVELTPRQAWVVAAAPMELRLSYLEAAALCLAYFVETQAVPGLRPEHLQEFTDKVNRILNAHRVAYKLVDNRVIPIDSEELHAAVVEPVLYLLHGRPDLSGAHQAYLKALKEISRDDAADAITDAGTALQEALHALGCSGNSLGDLTKSAKARGLLGSYDQKMTNAVAAAAEWAAAERNNGEAHHAVADAVPLSDAWLMVHVVGALIIRLADGAQRSSLMR